MLHKQMEELKRMLSAKDRDLEALKGSTDNLDWFHETPILLSGVFSPERNRSGLRLS